MALSERVVWVTVAVLGLWTIADHAVVALNGSFVALLMAGPLTVGTGLAVTGRWLLCPRKPDLRCSGAPTVDGSVAVAVTGAATLAVIGLLVVHSDQVFWWASVVALAAGVFVALRTPLIVRAASGGETPTAPSGDQGEPSAQRTGNEIPLWIMAVAAAGFALILHKPENDDGFFVAFAARAVDDPTLALMSVNPVLGIPDLPIGLPVYLVHSLGYLAAAVSWATGLPAIAVFHLVLGPGMAALTPLAWAALYRRLVPFRVVPLATGVTLALLVLLARTPWGGDTFTQPWIGNTAFLSVLLPMIATAAWDVARDPTAVTCGRLLLAQIAAVGATSTALWAAPVTATYFGLAGLVAPSPHRLRAAFVGLATCGYAVGAGLVARSLVLAGPSAGAAGELAPEVGIALVTRAVFATPAMAAMAWLGITAGWLLHRRRDTRHVAVVVPLLFLVTMLNPFATDFVARNTTSIWVFDRVLWVLPVPLLLGLVVTEAICRFRRTGPRVRAAIVIVGLIAVASASVWEGFARRGLRNVSIVRFPPGLKVPRPAWDIVTHVHERLEPGDTVLAVEWIALWFPTFHNPRWPLASRRHYVSPLRDAGRAAEADQRVLLSAFVGGELGKWSDLAATVDDWEQYFVTGLEELRPTAVVISDQVDPPWDLSEALRRSGYELDVELHDHTIWIRSPSVNS